MATSTPRKKGGIWFIVIPILLIILLLISKNFDFSKSTNDGEAKNNTSDLQAPLATPAPAMEKDSEIVNHSFSPAELSELIYLDSLSFANKLKSKGYELSIIYNYTTDEKEVLNTYDFYYASLQNCVRVYRFHVIKLSNMKGVLRYMGDGSNFSESFIQEVHKIPLLPFPKEKHDKRFVNSEQFLTAKCVFISTDSGVIMIRNDFIIPVGKINTDDSIITHQDSNLNSKNYTKSQQNGDYEIKYPSVDVYQYASNQYGDIIDNLKEGKVVEYVRTNGGYIEIKYNNDGGVPVEGYVNINSVKKIPSKNNK